MAINLEMLPTRPYLIGIFWTRGGGDGGSREQREEKEIVNHERSKLLQAGFTCKEIVTSQNKIIK